MRESFKFSAQPVTILLVDDDEDCRQLIRDAIEQGKLDNPVFEVSSGEEALVFLRREGITPTRRGPGLCISTSRCPAWEARKRFARSATIRASRISPS